MPNIEALRQLRRVVENAAEEQFDMGSYQNECGTTRCAAGHAAFDPWHQQNTRINEVLPIIDTPHGKELECGLGIFEGLEEIYGIDESDAGRLFYPDSTLSRAEVIASIDSIIAGNGAIDYDAEGGE